MLPEAGATVMQSHAEWMAQREAEAAKWAAEDAKRERPEKRWTIALAVAFSLLGAVGGTFIGGILIPVPTPTTRARSAMMPWPA
jgi:hypothetical protein